MSSRSGSGNGFLYSSKYIITNYHVINKLIGIKKQAQTNHTVSILLTSGKKREASVIYYECDKDLALLEIKGEPIKFVDLVTKEHKDTLVSFLYEAGVSFTNEHINKVLNSYLYGTIPLTQEVKKGDVVEYFERHLTKIEKGELLVLNNDYGIIENSNIILGNSGGGVFHKGRVTCVIQGVIKHKTSSEPKNDRRASCISSAQLESFMERSNDPTKKFCECKNFLLILGAINKYNTDKKEKQQPLTLHYLKSAQQFLKQASEESMEADKKLTGLDWFYHTKQKLKKLILDRKTNSTGKESELKPEVCSYF